MFTGFLSPEYVNACLSHCLNPFVLECVTFQMCSLVTFNKHETSLYNTYCIKKDK